MKSFGQSSANKLDLEFVYTNYTTKEGLPSNEVYCLLQDRKGYIWFGTDRGLVKYNGYRFETYTTLDGLTDNVILALAEDDKGNLWYTGLNNNKVGYIDSEMNFKEYSHNLELDIELSKIEHPNIYFNEIYIEDNFLFLVNKILGYVKLSVTGINKISIKNIEYKAPIETHFVSSNNIDFVYSNPCYNSINCVLNSINKNGKSIFSYKKRKCSDVWPTWVKLDSLEFVYDGYDMLQIYNGNVKHVTLPYKCVAFQVKEGGYIFSTFNTSSSTVYYSDSPNIFDPKIKILEDVIISNVLKDKDGRLWLATIKNGIFYLPDLASRKSQNNFQVEAILPSKGKLLLKLNNQSHYYYYLGSETLENLNNNIDNTALQALQYRTQYFNFFSPIRVLDSTRFKFNDLSSGFLRMKGGQYLSDSLYYLFSQNNLIKVKNNIVNNSYREIRNKGTHQYNFPLIQTVYCKKEDDCYLGTKDGLYYYNGIVLEALKIESGKSIRDIHYNYKIKAWIYAVLGEGLTIKYDDGRIEKLTDVDGLMSNFINQSFIDDEDRLWLATNNGINVCQFNDDQIKIEPAFNSSKLLNSPNVLQLYMLDSILYLGTDAGFNIIDLKSVGRSKLNDIPLIIENINVEGLDNKQFNGLLNYNQNSITFNYFALKYNQFGDLQYRYLLKGLSDHWIYTKERKAIFIGLPAGKYKFELEVQNEFGDWISLQNPPTFTISKPYWETWWFIGCGILFVISIIGGILYYYISNLKKEKAFVENEQLLSEELNTSRQKALSAQLNPHFVFNSLNSIQNFILTKRTELSSDYLSMFSKLMRFVFENSKSLYVPLSDEVEALRLYLELEQVRHDNRFKYHIETGTLSIQSIFIPSLLVQPIIENALWHGLLHKEGDDRLLEVIFTGDDKSLFIEIKDNGVGRHKTKPRPNFIKKQKSSGVELTQQRLKLLSQSTGLNTAFKVIDLIDANNKPCGTCVKIRIPIELKPE